MSAFDTYRAKFPKGTPDWEIVNELAKANEMPAEQIAHYFGVDLGVKSGKDRGPVMAGLASGTDALQGSLYGLGGALTDAAGWQGGADWFNKQAERNQMEAAIAGRPDLERIEDQTLGSALPYTAYQIAKQGPLIASLVGAQFIPGVGQVASATGLARLGAAAPRILGGGGLQTGANFAARRAALAQGEALASSAAMGGALGAGEMYNESVEAGDASPYAALGMAPLYGLAEAAIPGMVTGAFRRGGAASAREALLGGGVTYNMLKAGGKGIVGEAATEGVQNEMEMMFNPNLSEEEVASRRLNAIVAGGLVGGSLGSLGGVPQGMQRNRMVRDLQAEGYIGDSTTPADLLAGLTQRDIREDQIGRMADVTAEQAPFVEQGMMRQAEIDAAMAEDAEQQAEQLKADELAQRKQGYLSTLLGEGIPTEDAVALTEAAFAPKKQKEKAPTEPEYEDWQMPIVEQLKANGFPPKRIKAELKRIAAVRTEAGQPVNLPSAEQRLKEKANAVDSQVVHAGPQSTQAIQAEAVPAAQGAETKAVAEEENNRAVVGKLLDSLTPDERKVLTQYSFEKKTLEQIAAANKESNPKSWGTRGRAQQLLAKAKKKLAEAGAVYGLTEQKIGELFPDENLRMQGGADVETASAAEVAQAGGMHVPGTVEGPAISETQELEFGEGAGEFDEGFKSEATEVEEGAAEAPTVELAQELKDHRNQPIKQVDIDDARDEYNSDLVVGDPAFDALPKEEQAKFVKAYVAWQDKAISKSRFQNILEDLKNEYAEDLGQQEPAPQRAVEEKPTVEAVEERVQEKATPSNPVERRVAALKEQLGPKQQAQVDKLVTRFQSGEIDYERLGDELDNFAEQIEDGVKYSESIEPTEAEIEEVKALLSAGKRAMVGETSLTDRQADVAQTLLLSAFKEGTRKYERGNPLLTAVRRASDAASNDLGGKATAKRVVNSRLGPFSAYYTSATIDEDGTLNVEVWGKEQIDAGLTAEPALTFNLTPDGTIVVNGPVPIGRTFKAFKERGWATEATTKDGDTIPGWSRLVSATPKGRLPVDQLVTLFADVHARTKAHRRMSHVLFKWDRATGMMGLFDVNGGAMFFSEGTEDKGTTVEKIKSDLKKLFFSPAKLDSVVTVYATQDEAKAKTRGALSQAKGRVKGFTTPEGKVVLIAENIPAGKELGVALHEIGVHLGMEKLVGAANMKWLAGKVEEWAKRNDDSVETRVAKWAMQRAEASSSKDKTEERIAYMVEGLVNEGVTPDATKGEGTGAKSWMVRFYAALGKALKALGIRSDKFSGQNLVDLAMGAAHIEMKAPSQASDIKFSEAEALNKVGESFRGALTNPIRWAKEHGMGWLSLTHIAEVAKDLTPSVKDYLAVNRAMQVTAKKWVARAAETDLKWAKLDNKAVSDKLSDLMIRSTMATFDPSDKHAPKTPVEQEIKRNYDSLPSEAKALYAEVRDHYKAVMNERKSIMLDVVDKMYADKAKRANGDEKALAKIAKQKKDKVNGLNKMYSEMRGPYFPLMRLGRWYAVGMSRELATLIDKRKNGEASDAEIAQIEKMKADKKHYATKSYESERDALRGKAALAKQFPVTRYNVAKEQSAATKTLSIKGLEDVEAYIDEGFDQGTANKIKNMMADLYFESLPEGHTLKRQLKRKNIEGADTDMRRVFARSSINDAHYISRLKHQDDLRAALYKVDEESAEGPDHRLIFNELQKRANLSMDIQNNPVVDKLLNISYLAHLGANPAFILTNLTQVPMITMPWLSARYGVSGSTKAVRKAYSDATRIIKSSYKEQGWRAELDWKGKVSAGESQMLEAMLNRNLLDITIEHDLGATADMRSHKVGDALKMINLPVHISELANRTVTALATYRLEMAKNGNQEHAENAAAKALSETQLDYSAVNAPRHLQEMFGSKTIARLAGQFRKYQQGMLWLIGKNIYDAVKSKSKEEQQVALKTLVGLFTTTGTMGGALGMPMMGSLLWLGTLFGSAFDDDDDPFDAEVWFKNWLTDMLGADTAKVMTKGLPMVAGVDLSKRVGLGDVAAPLPFLRSGKTGQEKVGNVLASVAGAPAGMVADWVDGLQLIDSGHWQKGAEKIVPLKALRNLSAAERFYDEGMTKRNGDLIKEMNAWDVTLRALGFQSGTEASYYEANEAMQNAKKAATDTRTRLLAEYANAKLQGKPVDDIEDDIKDFNSRHPEKGVKIDTSSKLKAVQNRRKAQTEKTPTGVSGGKANQPYLDSARFAGS